MHKATSIARAFHRLQVHCTSLSQVSLQQGEDEDSIPATAAKLPVSWGKLQPAYGCLGYRFQRMERSISAMEPG